VRLLHTADWHLGRTIRGRSRALEFQAVLDEICGIAVQERVDVLLVAGDIWDTSTPSPEADRLLYRTLRKLVEAQIEVVLIAGNHDNPRRLAAIGQLADLLGVHAQSQVQRFDDGGTIHIERNGEQLRLAAIPWVTEGRAINAEQILGPTAESHQKYADFVRRVFAQSTGEFRPDTINVFASHVFIDGAVVSSLDGSERRLHIGQTYAVAPGAIPVQAQYAALGHIHQPQEIVGAPNNAAAYAGSILQLDFGEREQQKVVRLVDLEPGRPAKHRAIELTAGRRLSEVRGSFDEIVAKGEQLGDAYLRAVVRLERPEAGIAQRIREALPNCVDVRVETTARVEERETVPLTSLSPQELFVRYYEQTHESPPSTELLALFREVLAEAAAEQEAAT